MNKFKKNYKFFYIIIPLVLLFNTQLAFGEKPYNKFDEMLERLESIEAKLDHTSANIDRIEFKINETSANINNLEDKIDDLAGPQVSATFCISQGRGAELSGAFGAEFEVEVELGAGWTSAVYAKATPELDLPFFIPTPVPGVVIPVPTEAKIELMGGLGRATDICIDLPVTLSPDDQAQLVQMATDINSDTTNDNKGKFQKRAGRILQYADRRVPPLRQNFSARNLANAQAEQDMSNEFDRSDMAVDSLLENGFGTMSEGFDIFRDHNVRELLATLEIPLEVSDFMNDPERIFNGLPDLRGGEGPLFCNDAGISGAMRSRNERLDSMCTRLENLPTFDRLRKVPDTIDTLTDEVVDAIAAVLTPVLNNAGETAEQTKTRFCATNIGLRRAFNRYCGR